jgi:hypothetical protein
MRVFDIALFPPMFDVVFPLGDWRCCIKCSRAVAGGAGSAGVDRAWLFFRSSETSVSLDTFSLAGRESLGMTNLSEW